MTNAPRWFTETQPGHSQWYIDRFRKMAAEGADLAGEARFMDTLMAPHSHVLDAGCGPGRVGGQLHHRGHRVVGVDVDPQLIEAAEHDHPGPTWIQGDLTELDLSTHGITDPFDAAVVAGNVMTFLAQDTGHLVLTRLREHVRTDGAIVIGFGFGRGYTKEAFDTDIAESGLRVEHRFGTWDLRALTSESDFMVTVLRVP